MLRTSDLYAVAVCASQMLNRSSHALFSVWPTRKPTLFLTFPTKGAIPCLVLRFLAREADAVDSIRVTEICPPLRGVKIGSVLYLYSR